MAKYQRLMDEIQQQIEAGIWLPGTRLPSLRQQVAQQGVSLMTVLHAYELLESQGWIVSRERGVSRVATSARSPRASGERHERVAFPIEPPPEVDDESLPPGTLALAAGRPDLSLFPIDELARAWKAALRHSRGRLLEYGDPQGQIRLREALASYLSSERGLRTDASGIVLTRGSQQALYLTAAVLIRPGDRVAVERLGYPPAHEALRAHGATLVPIDIDKEGIDTDVLSRVAREGGLRAVYCTPHHQFPTMVSLSARRRLALLDLARRYQVAVIEDDYDNEFHFRGRPVPPLASRDSAGSVIYVGTLSKVLAPGLRLGFLVAPEPVVRAAVARRRIIDRQGDAATEAALAMLVEDGTLARHLRKMRRAYERRQEAAASAIEELLGGHVSFERPAGGLALWVRASGIDVACWQRRALREGVFFDRGDRYAVDQRPEPAMRIGFASLGEELLRQAVARLAASMPR